MDREAILNSAKDFTNELSKLMLLDDPDYKTTLDEGEVVVHISYQGESLGYMIGPRGRFLQSLQHIISNYLRKSFVDDKINVIVDAGGYLASRIERIEKMVIQKADDARILGDSIDLEPMTAFERKMVHKVLSKFDDIKTESFGEGENRYVKISLKSDKELGIETADSDMIENVQE